MMASRKADANEYSLELHWLCVCPCSESQLPPTCVGDPPILAGRSDPGSYEVAVSFPGSWCTQDPVCALSEWEFLFSPDLWNSCDQTLLAFKARFSGALPAIAGDPDMGLRTFTPVGEFLWYNSFPVCGSPIWCGCDLILSWLHPSYYPVVASSLFLVVEYLFL